MGVFEDIQIQYPQFAWLFQDPEVGGILRDAVSGPGFSQQEFEQRLKNTGWYKTRSQAQREWEVLWNTDKAEATRQIHAYQAAIRNLGSQMGIYMTTDDIHWFSTVGLNYGIQVGSAEFQNLFNNYVGKLDPKRFQTGAIKGKAHEASGLAKGQYYLNMSSKDAYYWGVRLATGQADEAALRQWLAATAMSKYTHLKDQLAAGKTMEDIFSGHKQVIAEELELDTDQIDMTKGQWTKIIDHYDPNTKSHRPYTLSEVSTLARQDPRFWNTAKGKGMSSSLSNTLLKSFGVRA